MIVCSCNLITRDDLRHAVDSIRAAAPDAELNAMMIYKALGKRPRCGNCLELADELIDAFAGIEERRRREREAPATPLSADGRQLTLLPDAA